MAVPDACNEGSHLRPNSSSKRSRQVIFQSAHVAEDEIIEVLFAKLAAAVRDRIEFSGVSWQGQRSNIVWRAEVTAGVPTCAVPHHDDTVIWMTPGYFIQARLHARGMDARQDQGIQRSGKDIDCGSRTSRASVKFSRYGPPRAVKCH